VARKQRNHMNLHVLQNISRFSQRLAALVHLSDASETGEMLRITVEKKRGKTVLNVEGRLAGAWVGALEQCWKERVSDEKFCVNLCGVSFIDAPGKVLLREIHRGGGKLVAEGCLNQAIVDEIAGEKSEKSAATDKKKGSHIIFYVAFFSLLVTPSYLRAQSRAKNLLPATAPTEVLRLTLDQAVALALKQNPTEQIAILSAAQSNQDKNIARAALLPQANLSVSDTAERLNLEAFIGEKFPGLPEHAGPFQIFTAGPTFSAPIFDLTLFRRYQAALDSAKAEKFNSLSTREQVILLVVSQYIGTLRAMASVQASESRVELAQALYDQAGDLQKQGVGTGIDTLRANVELQNEKQTLIESQADRDRSLYGLSKLLNLDPRQRIELADSLGFFDTPQPEVDTSIELALGQRQEWKQIQQQLRAAGYQKKAESESRLPELSFNGNWAYTGSSSTTGIPTYNYEAAVNMPIFTGGRIHAEVVKDELEIKKLEEQEDDLRNQIALDVKTALLNLDSARNEVQVANLGVVLSNQEVEQARDRFKAGVANNIEVIQAQDALARANDNQIAALYRFNQARADYARSVGEMEKVYAK
jgi:outer membrane protein